MNNKKLVIGVFAGIIIVVCAMLSGNMWEYVDSGDVCVIQDPVDGELHVYVGGTATGGTVVQNFGTPTHYKKSFQSWFSIKDGEGNDINRSIKIRFNDGGHAQVSGSVRINMPLDEKSMIKLHTIFGSQQAIENALITPTIQKAIYLTGPLMSSKESYAEKRNDLLSFIEDQVTNGVYKTITKEEKTKDELSGEEKTISKVDIVMHNGIIQRNTVSPLKEFNVMIASGTLALNSIDYDPIVEKQIEQQQQATMQVQTAMANAKRAEQDAITVMKQGEASAAKAKWEQEVVKAKLVTEAQQKLEVQTLATKQAELYKQQQILEGQGEAEKKKLIMSADGALDKKLEAYKEVQGYWADAFSKFNGNLVPLYQSGNTGNNNAMNWMEIMGMKAAKDLGLDMGMKKGAGQNGGQ